MRLVGDASREVAGGVAGDEVGAGQVAVFNSAALRLCIGIKLDCGEMAGCVVGVADVWDRIYRIVRIECVASCAAEVVPFPHDGVRSGSADDGLVGQRTVGAAPTMGFKVLDYIQLQCHQTYPQAHYLENYL